MEKGSFSILLSDRENMYLTLKGVSEDRGVLINISDIDVKKVVEHYELVDLDGGWEKIIGLKKGGIS